MVVTMEGLSSDLLVGKAGLVILVGLVIFVGLVILVGFSFIIASGGLCRGLLVPKVQDIFLLTLKNTYNASSASRVVDPVKVGAAV
jgi:hypothetical protein